ncbi:MAG: bifunctional UDP-N-acetylmuramoyl-tripeptide:D-alanyl-D-alanine ligase/alanine racemase [Bacteroidia bacterium]
MYYIIHHISKIINGQLQLGDTTFAEIKNLITDSRKIVSPENSLFFALKGARNDGHQYIKELISQGVKNFVVSNPLSLGVGVEANFILVADTLQALQSLSVHHRKKFSYPVIGITGSNGKTIVKEWLYTLLREQYNIVRSPKSYNSQIGVPLSVWMMKEENDLGIFEAGISLKGEMENLEKIIQPTIGIFTNIGTAHDENFKDHHEKIIEKLKLFVNCKALIFCKDHADVFKHISHLLHEQKRSTLPGRGAGGEVIKQFSWSREHKADLEIGQIQKLTTETIIEAFYKEQLIAIRIPFIDDASIENAIQCWALMLYLNFSNDSIADKMLLLSPVAMRLEMKEGINNCSIINDSYNSDIGSLTIALDFLNQQKQHQKRTVVLSDILQSGKDENILYKEVADLIKKKNVNRLIGIGSAISRQANLFDGEKLFYNSTEDFFANYKADLFEEETILLKGARTFGFERISKLLQQKAHETVLEINLNALIHNLNFYRSIIRPETKMMCMVKAFAYGSGSFEIANTLQFHRVNYLAVAYADEGVELRKGGITLPIMVMSPEEQSFDTMIDYNLEPELYSFRVLKIFNEAAQRKLSNAEQKKISIHLKLDTGMHRLGFEENDLDQLILDLKQETHLHVQSVFSHLAGSDEQVHDNFTKEQIEKFRHMSSHIQSAFDHHIMRHILNSAGIVRFPDAQFEMVRLGIGLHGIGSTDAENKMLQHVATLKTTISQIKNIAAGETIGYSRKGIAKNDIRIATVAIGYADGLNRKLSNDIGKMIVNGKPASIIGNVCMDMCMLDVTQIDCKEGDDVIVFGKEYPIENIAQQTGTIAYEVLTGISQRVKRVYYHE